MHLQELFHHDPDWHNALSARLQRIQPDAHTIPDYFLASTFPRIGGRLFIMTNGQREVGVALLFPRQLLSTQRHCYTLRTQPFQGCNRPAMPDLVAVLQRLLPSIQIVPNDPLLSRTYQPDTHPLSFRVPPGRASVEIGHPTQAEAAQIPILQQQVWGGSLADCYPADLHTLEFAPGTSLAARVRTAGTAQEDSVLAGFLLGFYKFGGYGLPADWQARFTGEFRLESQIMAVLPHYRGMRIANLLKRQQALDAMAQGIGIVNWTVDPLQSANARLNFGLLRAIAFDFTPNYYPFRNQLNRVPASRFGITWLVQSQRVREVLGTSLPGRMDSQITDRDIPFPEGAQGRIEKGASAQVIDLAEPSTIVRINDGWQRVDWAVDASQVAIEIPADWTALQREDLEAAIRWREVTDRIFAHYVGKEAGQYVITDVGVAGDRRYLIGQQVNDTVWMQLSFV